MGPMQLVESLPQRQMRDDRDVPLDLPPYSVVAPVYNEEALVAEFCQRTSAALEPLGEPFEDETED